MEAITKHAFSATQEDDLGFEKGTIVNVLDMDQDQNWYKAEQNGREGWVPQTYIEMRPHSWFHSKITRKQAEAELMGQQGDESFLVRESESTPDVWIRSKGFKQEMVKPKAFTANDICRSCGCSFKNLYGDFSLSVKYGGQVQHFKIFRDAEKKYFLWNKKFDSINQLIDYHRYNSVSRSQNIILKDANDSMIVTALFDFKAHEEGEISFSRGDRITVLDASNKDWWEGKVNGQVGLFPANYVSKP